MQIIVSNFLHSRKQIKLLPVILLCFGLTTVNAQETISAAGNTIADPNGSVSYSIGQIFYSTVSDSAETISQGVQQAYEIINVTGIKTTDDLFSFSLFPNPTSDVLTLQTSITNLEDLSYEIVDINNKLIERKNVTSDHTKIIMADYSPGVYFFNLTHQKKLVQSFKVLKN